MTSPDSLVAVVDALEASGVPYMVVGSISSNIYGMPRSTQDADIVVQLGNVSMKSIAAKLGDQFKIDAQMSFETITGSRRYVIEHIPTQFKIELFLLRDDEYHQTRFSRRRRVEDEDNHLWVASPEDVIVMKLKWGRDARRGKDLEDIKNLLLVTHSRGQTLDWDYIHHWCDVHGTRALLDELRRNAT